MEKIQKRNWFASHKILTGVLIFIACGLFIGAVSSGSKQQDAAKAQYTAEVRDYSVVNPSTLRVDIKVHNTGSVSSKWWQC